MNAQWLPLLAALTGVASACAGSTPGADGAGETGETGDGSCEHDAEQPIITTTLGPVIGASESGVSHFFNIPYAAAPLAERRFRPPEPAQPWVEPRDATTPGDVCVQLLGANGDASTGSEDCLQLNIWTPEGAAAAGAETCEGADLPVLFFIHGGGNAIGSGVDPIYAGSKLAAAEQVVVVTFNYRLGALGYLALPELDLESGEGVSGNYGLRDQIAALAWVHANIARFGGDPERILVFGESAGAVNTCALIGAPTADGLFGRALLQSGSCAQPSRANVDPIGAELVESAGCAGDDIPACLRAIPAAELVALSPTGYPSVAGLARGWGPHVDGVLVPQRALEAMEQGVPGVPLVVGSNRDETAMDTPPNLSEADYHALVTATFSALAQQVLGVYPPSDYASPSAAWSALTADVKFVCGARRTAVASSAGGAPTWRYQFAYDAYTAAPGVPTFAFHGLELVYLFANFDAYPPNPGDLEISAAIQHRWARFAAIGDFDGPFYVPADDPYLELDVPVTEGLGLRTKQCNFWDKWIP